MATTHEEIYRPFEGRLRSHPLRFWPVLAGTLQVAVKRKLPLLLLYVAPAIATIVISFLVYVQLTAEEAELPEGMGGAVASMAIRQAKEILEVRNQIFQMHNALALFAILAVAWYGGGLICDDRRVGAHQLYFCRPLTRLDYFLGKFLASAFFAALAILAPPMVVCLVATVAAPGWSFVTDQWDVPLRVLAYAGLWITLVVSLVLAASALAPRKSFALVGICGFWILMEALGNILGELQSEALYAISLARVVESIAGQLFQRSVSELPIEPARAWTVAVLVILGCWVLIGSRLRRLEVVG